VGALPQLDKISWSVYPWQVFSGLPNTGESLEPTLVERVAVVNSEGGNLAIIAHNRQ